MAEISLSLFKSFALGERAKLEARGEFFNALNHVNYNNPNVTFTPGANGQNNNANFGRVTSALEARRVQVGMRISF